MARVLATAGGNAVWTPGETFTAVLKGTRSIVVDDEERQILEFRNTKGESFERWGSSAFLKPLAENTLRKGDCITVTAHPKRGKGKKQFCPFDITVLEPGDSGYFT